MHIRLINIGDKHEKKLPSFFSGMIVMAVIVSFTGTALAASGAVSFNTANLSINGNRIIQKGSTLKTSSGSDIPSIIQYTDTQGKITNYVSVRFLADALGMDVSWRARNSSVDIEVEGDASLYTMEQDNAGVIFDNGELEEVDPTIPTSGNIILSETNQSAEPFETTLELNEESGDYISITITNNGNYPLQFDLGRKTATANVTNPSAVPAGQSTTRTLKISTWESLSKKPIYIKIGNAEYITRNMDFSVEVTQFSE